MENENEQEQYVIISKNGGLVIMSASLSNREVYEANLRLYGRENSLLYSKYGIKDEDFDFVIGALDKIHGKPLSEVSEKVEGLIAKLKGETQ